MRKLIFLLLLLAVTVQTWADGKVADCRGSGGGRKRRSVPIDLYSQFAECKRFPCSFYNKGV